MDRKISKQENENEIFQIVVSVKLIQLCAANSKRLDAWFMPALRRKISTTTHKFQNQNLDTLKVDPFFVVFVFCSTEKISSRNLSPYSVPFYDDLFVMFVLK